MGKLQERGERCEMKHKIVKVGLIQMSVPADRDQALQKAGKLVRQAARQGAKIICLGELFNTPYFPQQQGINRDDYAESVPGNTSRQMAKLAKELKIVLITPIYEKRGSKYFNTALVFDEQGKMLGKYDKTHIPEDPGFYEREYFEEGKTGYIVFKTKYANFSVFICYDQWFPEAARAAKLGGAEIIFYPTAIGNILGYRANADWHEAWETAQRAHGIVNNLYIATVNRVGREGRMQFFGQSFVSDPFGKLLKRGSKIKEEVLARTLDLSRNEYFTEGWGFLRNRRPDTYKDVVSKKFVEKSRKLKSVAHYKQMQKALEGK